MHQSDKWLVANFGENATAVAGSFRRVLGGGKDSDTVMEAMRRFCAVYSTTEAIDRQGRADPMRSATLEGRRQAYLFIVGILSLDAEQLKPKEEPEDERSSPRSADNGPEPSPRYAGDYDPYLDGPLPGASADDASG